MLSHSVPQAAEERQEGHGQPDPQLGRGRLLAWDAQASEQLRCQVQQRHASARLALA